MVLPIIYSEIVVLHIIAWPASLNLITYSYRHKVNGKNVGSSTSKSAWQKEK